MPNQHIEIETELDESFDLFAEAATKEGLVAKECSIYHWQIRTPAGNVNFYPTKGKIWVDGDSPESVEGAFASEAIAMAVTLRKKPSRKKGHRSERVEEFPTPKQDNALWTDIMLKVFLSKLPSSMWPKDRAKETRFYAEAIMDEIEKGPTHA
jgi:hypothetical protein